jgi:hypothetical protein
MRKKKETYDSPLHSKKKYTSKNKQNNNFSHSVLQKHESILNEFEHKKKEKLTMLNSKINTLSSLIQDYESKILDVKHIQNNKISNTLAQNKINLEELKREYKTIENDPEQLNYILESTNIIQEFIDLEDRERELLNVNDLSEENSIELNDINLKKNEITNIYFCKFDSDYKLQNQYLKSSSNLCKECNLPYHVEKSFLVCINCGICKPTVEQAVEMSYKDLQEFDYRPQFTYDKMTHLEDWLRRFQAKENRSIPQEILDKVILETKKERIQNLNNLTEDKVKRYLKKLNLNDYYDNVIGIINRINGRPPFMLTPEIEDKIKFMFQQIQEPYNTFKPSGRKNFLSYSYTLHKFFQILGLHEFAKYFPLLKSTDKLRQQDDIFKKIVAYMAEKDHNTKWVFYPSI